MFFEIAELLILALGFLIGLPGMFISIFMYLFYYKQTADRLSEVSPDVYAELGKPSLFLNNTMRNTNNFVKWLHARKFESINDEQLSSVASSALKTRFAAAICMVGFAVAALVMVLQNL